MAALSCNDDEDAVGGTTAGSSSGGMGGKSTAGSSNAGTAGKSTAGSSNGGSAGSGTAGTSTAGAAGTATGGTDTGGAAGEGGTAGGGDAGATTDGGMGGTGDAGGEGGGPDVGPHQTPRLAYHFDENAGTVVADSSGRELDATLSQAAWTADGRNGAAMSLAGGPQPPPQYATVPAGVFDGAKALTIATWVKEAAHAPWTRVFDFGSAINAQERFMYLALNSNAGVRFSYFGGAANREPTVTTGTALPLNVWKHVAVTMAENGEQAIYIDGFPAAKAANPAVPLSELQQIPAQSFLGRSRTAFPDAGFQGAMDDFVVYDRVLPADEIAVLADPKADYSRLPFDEAAGATSEDVSDRAADAVLNGGATWTTGRLRAGVQLSGTDQYVTLTNPIAGCTTELSISLWVKHLEAKNWSRILDFGGTSDNFMFLAPSTHEGKMHFTLHTATRETAVTISDTIPVENVWHHLAVVITPTVGSVYVDGEVVGNMPNPVTPTELGATNEHWLGKSRFPDPYFNGAFDEVRIMCRALTPDEVKNLAFKD
jgi:hypothetical protein